MLRPYSHEAVTICTDKQKRTMIHGEKQRKFSLALGVILMGQNQCQVRQSQPASMGQHDGVR